MYGMTTALGATLLGVALFLILRIRLRDVEARLKMVVRVTLCAMVLSWVIPFVVVLLRGEGFLPPWTAWLTMLVVLVVLVSYWRSVLNHWEARGKSPLEQMAEKQENARIEESSQGKAKGREMGEPSATMEGGETSNLLADIAREHLQREAPGKEPQEDHFPSRMEEPFDSMLESAAEGSQVSVEAEEITLSIADREKTANPIGDHAPEKEEMGLVIHPYATRLSLREIVIRAWDAREAGQTQEAFSWFLSGLAASPGKTIRDELLLDACALLHEHEQQKLTRALLESEYAEGMEESLRERIRSSVSSNRYLGESG